MLVHAPAKLNLCLYLGAPREDGLHELCSLFEPLALADLIEVSPAERDEVVCPGVEGENLAARALAGLRERGWEHEALRIEIEKRVPVAAGLGGGSGDAAAVLRLAAGEVEDLPQLAAELGADVPSQLRPSLALVRGAGERVEPLPAPADHAAVLLPGGGGLSTAEVFAEADRLGLGRSAEELDELATRLREVAGAGASPLSYPELLVNDLEPAALSLRPDIGKALAALRAAGAALAILSGSGPTAVGLFPDLAAAREAAAATGYEEAIVCAAGHAKLAR
jgi:4-diphosphocytidyl-2-C-methyl-D-erythritol kinase